MDFITAPLTDMTVVPDEYSPCLNENGEYYDKMPVWNTKGYYCGCGSRKQKVLYDTANKLHIHMKCKKHKEWVAELNLNKTNYYQKNKELQITIDNQRLIIANMQREMEKKQNQINCLLEQLVQKNREQKDCELLNFD